MEVNTPPAAPSAVQPYLIASVASVDANALATTDLSWATGMTAANTIPLFMRVYRATGTLALLIGQLKLNSVIVQTVGAAESVVLAATSSALQYPISSVVGVQVVPIAGNYQFTVATVNGTASTVRVEVYGFKVA
jgi:hypothetical protein